MSRRPETDADRLRALLEKAGLSQRGAARQMGISERMMRYYCAGEYEIPRVVLLAAERLAELKSGTK